MLTALLLLRKFLFSPLGIAFMCFLALLGLSAWVHHWYNKQIEAAKVQGHDVARAEYQVEKDKYFGQLSSAAAAFAAGSTVLADNSDKASKAAATNIANSVTEAVNQLKGHPFTVYNTTTGRCEMQGNALGLRWSAINKAANQKVPQ